MNYGKYYSSCARQSGNLEMVHVDQDSPESLRSTNFTPGFLREHIGKLVRVEFLIGTNGLTDRTGILVEVGASYIVLQSVQDSNLLYCDIYSIKFVTISQEMLLSNPYYQIYT